jgi:hypothetical protein
MEHDRKLSSESKINPGKIRNTYDDLLSTHSRTSQGGTPTEGFPPDRIFDVSASSDRFLDCAAWNMLSTAATTGNNPATKSFGVNAKSGELGEQWISTLHNN